MNRLRLVLVALSSCLVLLPTPATAADTAVLESEAFRLGEHLSIVAIVPFIAMLLSIAVLPLFAAHWWEKNRNKAIVAGLLALPVIGYLVIGFGHHGFKELEHTTAEYISFLILLGSLFVVSGGIHVQGSLSGTPLVNSGMLACGAVLANVVGTTGASMLLIRPLIQANKARANKAHLVVFFIFMVSNCGGLLTPLGDPPLFLGFLNGVPFGWTLRLWPQWAFINGMLLVLFNVWDQVVLNREEQARAGSQLEEVMQHEPLRILGWRNAAFLSGIVLTIFASGQGLGNGGKAWPYGVQETIMLLLTVASYAVTSAEIRTRNRFGFGPIIEVAVLFFGIFLTMTPALLILNVVGSKMGIDEPCEFFWYAGLLSSFLDNAPTYLAFAATACGMEGVALDGPYLATLLTKTGAPEVLAAIACGSVFMGANTYIGNGPNFMVKAIAEENQVKMPGFFGYMLYSGCVLIPLFIVATFLFFR